MVIHDALFSLTSKTGTRRSERFLALDYESGKIGFPRLFALYPTGHNWRIAGAS